MKTIRTSLGFAAIIAATLLSPRPASADMHDAMEDACDSNQCLFSDLTREVVAGVAHYSVVLKVGPGLHDKVLVERFVKEHSPWNPKATPKNLFLISGDTLTNKAAWEIGPDGTISSSFAVYLAQHDIDVWMVGARWTLVPESVTDHAFMADWDIDLDIQDARYSMLVARWVRYFTGSGGGRLNVLGWSRGGQKGYIMAGLDSQLPSWQRSINTYIPFDTMLKTDIPELQAAFCNLTDQIVAARANGVYSDSFVAIRTAGVLAETDPDAPSPILPSPPFPPMTNYEAVLFFGGATHVFTPYGAGYHLVGAEFGPDGVPTGLLFTEPSAFIETVQSVASYEANGVQREGNEVLCRDTVHDDHLGDISVPVFNIGGLGGLGAQSVYTTTLLSSSPEVQNLVIDMPGVDQASDFGHDDIIRSALAPGLVWDPIISWINSH